MNHHHCKRIAAVSTLALVITLPAGCNGAEELTLPGPDVEAEVTEAARTGALAGPSGDIAADMVAGMIGLTCPETFELLSGISGNCSMDEAGVKTFLFGGDVQVDGDAVTVEGSMTSVFNNIDLFATVFGMRGSATWAATGTVLPGDAGKVMDYDLIMTHTITPVGGETVVVRSTADPSMLDMSLTGPLGGNVEITLDRETMTGIVSFSGIEVAIITIADGCATIVSGIPAIPDQTVCAGPM